MRARKREEATPPALELESELRSIRPPRRPEFAAALTARVRRQVGDRRGRPTRFGLAIALTVTIIASLASVGGLGYAASASERAAKAVRHVVVPATRSGRTVAHGTAAEGQYKATICHYSGSASSPWVQLTVGTSTVKGYLARGDFIVTPANPCPPRVRCSIGSIVGRSVAVSCNAGKSRAGKRWAILVRKTIVARGKVGKGGLYSTRFTVQTLLARGTKINFLVDGKTVATLRV